MYVEPYGNGSIALSHHVCTETSPLSKIHSYGDTVVKSENRQSHSKSYAYGIDLINVKSIILLVIVNTGPVGTPSQIIPDVISVGNYLESCTE